MGLLNRILPAACAALLASCHGDVRRCTSDRDCSAESRCVLPAGLCVLNGTPDASTTCTEGATRPCAGGCNNEERCTAGEWSSCAPVCPTGTVCQNDRCQCTPSSCGGCCDGDQCRPGDQPSACGAAGATCDTCPTGDCVQGRCNSCASTCDAGCCTGSTCKDPSLISCGTLGSVCLACDALGADHCDGGSCRCGPRDACPRGQRCTGTTCVCDELSCAGGCCSNGACTAPAAATCGIDGGACFDCGSTADRCTNGACLCGTGPACASGQRCSGGRCICDGTSCPSGCCDDGGTCQPNSASACGVGGAACARCPRTADSCVFGTCVCGSGTACSTDQYCFTGACLCDWQNCAGCCNADQGGHCITSTLRQCGDHNFCGDCLDAGVWADTCSSSGQCRCGSNPPCTTGQLCSGGMCVCNATSCPNGCCNGNVCVPYASQSNTRCGAGGASCAACTARNPTCSNGSCQCNTGLTCSSSQTCSSGSCVCNSTSCPAGCCTALLNGTCQAGTAQTACGNNGAVCANCTATTCDPGPPPVPGFCNNKLCDCP